MISRDIDFTDTFVFGNLDDTLNPNTSLKKKLNIRYTYLCYDLDKNAYI